LGIGTIVGSAVFKIAVIAISGLTAGFTIGIRGVKLEWYPITRDTLCYAISLLMLIGFLLDEKVGNSSVINVFLHCYPLYQ
jgi:Ca2+/Na+ antiporter